jgi:hypothetical protein
MNISFKPLQDTDRINGSSFHHDVVFATPNELRHILGAPIYDVNDGTDKVNIEWYMEMPDGNVFTVYDYKEYRVLHPNEQVEWHIGGHDRFSTHLAKQLLSEALQEAADELRHSMSMGAKFKATNAYDNGLLD